MYDDFFTKAHELMEAGLPFAMATVVRAERPTSGKPGDKAIITADGVLHGWIGGSCAQPAVVQVALEALAQDRGRLLRLSPDPGKKPVPEGVEEVPMTCFSGGTLDIYVEPQHPRPRLMVVGSLPVARALIHLGKALSYRVIAVDPEAPERGPSTLEAQSPLPGADERLTRLEDIPSRANAQTWIVVASHGHYDELALEQALKTPAPYVALVASRKRGGPILEELRRRGVPEADLARLKVPAGLDIGARRGDEIALSILAEIVQKRREVEAGEKAVGTKKAVAETAAPPPAAGSCCGSKPIEEATTATDLVCGMSVKVAGALHTYQHEGVLYYFCCAGCRTKFAAEPGRYLQA